ncbi:MAG: rod shape-determining protein MreD [Candidatus Omnitrophica bacterium]|nr:rod shape-determining protein MreD [Candidatus Omnitrophota bacterium]
MHTLGRVPVYATILAALFFQLALGRYIAIAGAQPDLVLVFVIFFSVFLGGGRGLETGVVAGFMKDIFSVDVFGTNALVLGVTGLAAGYLSAKFFRESKRTHFFLTFFFALFSMALTWSLARTLSGPQTTGLAEYLAVSAVPSSLYTAAVSVPVFLKCIDLYGLRRDEEFL